MYFEKIDMTKRVLQADAGASDAGVFLVDFGAVSAPSPVGMGSIVVLRGGGPRGSSSALYPRSLEQTSWKSLVLWAPCVYCRAFTPPGRSRRNRIGEIDD